MLFEHIIFNFIIKVKSNIRWFMAIETQNGIYMIQKLKSNKLVMVILKGSLYNYQWGRSKQLLILTNNSLSHQKLMSKLKQRLMNFKSEIINFLFNTTNGCPKSLYALVFLNSTAIAFIRVSHQQKLEKNIGSKYQFDVVNNERKDNPSLEPRQQF